MYVTTKDNDRMNICEEYKEDGGKGRERKRSKRTEEGARGVKKGKMNVYKNEK